MKLAVPFFAALFLTFSAHAQDFLEMDEMQMKQLFLESTVCDMGYEFVKNGRGISVTRMKEELAKGAEPLILVECKAEPGQQAKDFSVIQTSKSFFIITLELEKMPELFDHDKKADKIPEEPGKPFEQI